MHKREVQKKARLATQCLVNPTNPCANARTNARYATRHLQLIVALFVQVGPARPALLVQVGAELADGDLGTAVGSNAVATRAHPRPLHIAVGVALEVVLPRGEGVEAEGDAVELRASRGVGLSGIAARAWGCGVEGRVDGAHALEGLGGVVPYPERVPQRVPDGLDVEVELLDVAHVPQLGADLARQRPVVGGHVAWV